MNARVGAVLRVGVAVAVAVPSSCLPGTWPLWPRSAARTRASGGTSAATRRTRATRRSTRSTPAISRSSRSRGSGGATTSARRWTTSSAPTPIYVDGMLYTVAGQRRTVAAIDPGTGETLWTYREPHTTRYERGMRNNYGKGVAYGEVNGRGVIFYTSPAFFLHALDAKTGEHLENWGTRRSDTRLPTSGVIDMLPDLVRDWEPWTKSGLKYDAGERHPPGARQPVDLVAADRRQRRRGGWQRPRAGLLPDAHREHPRRHPRLRRRQRKAPVEVSRHSAAGRVRPRDVGERRVEVDRRRLLLGADVRRPGARDRLHSDQSADDRLLRRLPSGQQPVRHEHPRARRQDAASACGTSRPSITTSGTSTTPLRRCCST